MPDEEFDISHSERITTNTLPLIFDLKNNTAIFGYGFDTGFLKSNKPTLFVDYTFKVFNTKNEEIGLLNSKMSYTINSSHSRNKNFQLFHYFAELEVDEFKDLFKNYKLINYPLDKIHIPTFEDMLPILIQLFDRPDELS